MASPARRRKRLTDRKDKLVTPPPTRPTPTNHASSPAHDRLRREGEQKVRRGSL